MLADLIPGQLVPGNGLAPGLIWTIGVVVVGLVTAIFVKRTAIVTSHRQIERARLTEDTQWVIDHLRERYNDLDAKYTSAVGALHDQLQNLAVQYAAVVAENGELKAEVSTQRARVQTLEAELRRTRLDFDGNGNGSDNGLEGRGGSLRQEE